MTTKIFAPNKWTAISDLIPDTSTSDKFKGQVRKGIVLIASETTLPTTDDHYSFRSAEAGGFTDEWFEVGGTGKVAYIKALDGQHSEVIVEVVV